MFPEDVALLIIMVIIFGGLVALAWWRSRHDNFD
jgi:hypothetical protein